MVVIGIDIGTTSVCGVAVDAETGRQLSSRTLSNTAALASARPFERRQDPLKIRDLCRDLSRSLLGDLAGRKILGIGVTGQMHGMLYLDRAGNPLSPLWTWQDGSGMQPDPRLPGKTYAEHLADITGYPAATGYGLTTHFYHRANGLVPEGAVVLSTIHDWIAMTFSRRSQPLLHLSDAASFGVFDAEHGDFDRAALERAEICELLPACTGESAVIGETSEGTPVCVAIGDNQASVLGSVRGNALLVNVGTGSQVSAVTDRFFRAEDAEIRPFVDGTFLAVGCALCGGYAYSLLRQFFCATAELLGAPVPDDLYERMNRAAAAVPPEERISACTQFSGTRAHPDRRASFSDSGTRNFTPQHLTRGVLDGICRELFDLYQGFRDRLPGRPQGLVGSGNGIRKNPLLCRIFSETFGMPIRIPLYEEEAAYGAALFALRAVSGRPLSEVQQKIQTGETV